MGLLEPEQVTPSSMTVEPDAEDGGHLTPEREVEPVGA